MIHRILAASIILLCSGPTAALSAASNGRSAHSLELVKPGQSMRFPAPTFRPAVRGFRAHGDAFRPFSRRHFAGFPWWGYEPYGPDYFPSDYAPDAEPLPLPYLPFENFSERSRPPVFYRPGCRTDTQTVPSESGGERTIHITRCY
jgi:hypothetical protein